MGTSKPVFNRFASFFLAALLAAAVLCPFAFAAEGSNAANLFPAPAAKASLAGSDASPAAAPVPAQAGSEAGPGALSRSGPKSGPKSGHDAKSDASGNAAREPSPAEGQDRPAQGFRKLLEELLDGSLVGSVLLGLPYKGFNTTDLAILLVIVWLFLRSFRSRLPGLPGRKRNEPGQGSSQDSSSGGRPSNPHDGPSPWGGSRNMEGRTDNTEQKPRIRPEDLRPPQEYGKPDQPENSGENRPSPWPEKRPGPLPGQDREKPRTMKDNAAQAWQRFSSKQELRDEVTLSPEAKRADLPSDFNSREFMEGARLLYTRLQNAWAARDLADIAEFTTPAMLAVIKEQASRDPTPTPVHIVLVDGRVKGVERQGQEEIVSVLFNTLLRVGDAAEAAEVREIWYFSRLLGRSETWKLDGIEEAA